MNSNELPDQFQGEHGGPPSSGVNLVCAASLQPELIKWLWPDWLAQGKFHLLAGAPGTGKTMISLNMAAIISNGGPNGFRWPDNTTLESPGKVLIWSGEDNYKDTILPRLMAASADLTRIHFIAGIEEFNRKRDFDFKVDLPKLSKRIVEIGGCDLIIIDSIVQAVAGDSNRNSAVRSALDPLVELGERHNCAILGITHVNKSSKGKEPLDRVTGSLAFGATARVVMLAATVQPDSVDEPPSSAVLVRAKSNVGKSDGGFEYQMQNIEFDYDGKKFNPSTICWYDEPLIGSAKNILNFAESAGTGGEKGKTAEAVIFLKSTLANGERKATDIQLMAHEKAISLQSIKHAKKVLGIDHFKQCGVTNGPWMWDIPEAQNNPFDSPRKLSQPQTHRYGKFNPESDFGHESESLRNVDTLRLTQMLVDARGADDADPVAVAAADVELARRYRFESESLRNIDSARLVEMVADAEGATDADPVALAAGKDELAKRNAWKKLGG